MNMHGEKIQRKGAKAQRTQRKINVVRCHMQGPRMTHSTHKKTLRSLRLRAFALDLFSLRLCAFALDFQGAPP